MDLTVKLDGEAASKFQKNIADAGVRVRMALRGAAKDAADEILARGADDIAAGGNFGERWQEALNVDIAETQQSINITAKMDGGPPVSYWKVFEYGATIAAKNPSGYLWLPFMKSDGTDVWPSAYAGDLFRATSKAGTPLLGDKDSKEWKYFGIPSVTIPQKFHLRDVVAQVAKEIKGYYAEHMNG